MFELKSTGSCCFLHSLEESCFIKRLSCEAESFLCSCLKHIEAERSSAEELLSHKWLHAHEYEGPDVSLSEISNLCVSSLVNSTNESAEKQLDNVVKALKVVLIGQNFRSESVPSPKDLADDLGLSFEFVRERVHRVFSEV